MAIWKKKTRLSKKAQYERFVETARKLGCDESEEAFEAAFEKIVPPKMPSLTKHRDQEK